MYKKIMVCVLFNFFGTHIVSASQNLGSVTKQHEYLYKQACLEELREGVKDHAKKLSVGQEVMYAVARCLMPAAIETIIKTSHEKITPSELKRHKACAVEIAQFYNKTRRQDEVTQQAEIEKFVDRYMECSQLAQSRTFKL